MAAYKGQAVDAKDGQRKGLGRGLSALFEDDAPPGIDPEELNQNVQPNKQGRNESTTPMVAIERLRPNAKQPRRVFEEVELESLSVSISQKGVLQPILVRVHPEEKDHYQIIAGERRWRAAQRAKLHEVPVSIMELGDIEALEIALIENIHREDLNILEEAEGYQQLTARYDYTQEAVAKAVGKSRSHVANLMRLLALPEEVKAMIQDGHLSMGHARALLAAKDPVLLAHEVIKKSLNVRQLEQKIKEQQQDVLSKKELSNKHEDQEQVALKKIVRGLDKISENNVDADPNITSLIQGLTNALGMHVDLAFDKKGESGQLTIHFQTMEQLDDVVQSLHKKDSDALF